MNSQKLTSKYITSVGIDIGTSTTHLVFSQLLLKEDPLSRSRKFIIADRKILYQSPIHFTPLEDFRTIDAEGIKNLLESEYKASGIDIADIDTGAVIITGETARKENAEAVLSLLAENAGKFVAATAGPNLESVLSCHGAGVTAYSHENDLICLHTDIGGGTSNIALVNCGKIITTACINVGGRLITYDLQNRITKLEKAAILTAEALDINLSLGEQLSNEKLEKISEKLIDSLFEILLVSPPYSDLTNRLMMTDPKIWEMRIEYHPDFFSFSGGVAEFIYESVPKMNDYSDIGHFLAKAIKKKIIDLEIPLHSPKEKIRATVIGTGQYSLEVSGSTTFISPSTSFPLKNLPVIVPFVDKKKFSRKHVEQAIINAYNRLDKEEGSEIVVLAFRNPVGIVYDKIKEFVLAIENALPITIEKNLPIILLFDTDIGKSVGNILKRETHILSDLISIDEIEVREGDFIDVGSPIIANEVVPVVIKSLIFN